MEEKLNKEKEYLDSQIYMIESSLSAIKKNIHEEEVRNGKGQKFFDYHMKEIYWRLELIQELIDKNKFLNISSNTFTVIVDTTANLTVKNSALINSSFEKAFT